MYDNYYEILEVSPKASTAVIEAAYRQLAKRYHPDLLQQTKRAGSDDRMKKINLAYETLKNPFKREQYDAFLKKYGSKGIKTHGKAVKSQGVIRQIRIAAAYLRRIKKNSINYKRVIAIPMTLLCGIIIVAAGTGIKNEINPGPAPLQSTAMESLNSDISIISVDKKMSSLPRDRFTLGSSQDDLRKVMGKPTSKFLYSWSYGNSLVYFGKDGKVDGWAEIDKTLKTWLGEQEKDAPPFDLGSGKDEVLRAMGTPTSVIGPAWGYGDSTVYFDQNERVNDWTEADRHLRIR